MENVTDYLHYSFAYLELPVSEPYETENKNQSDLMLDGLYTSNRRILIS